MRAVVLRSAAGGWRGSGAEAKAAALGRAGKPDSNDYRLDSACWRQHPRWQMKQEPIGKWL